MDRETIGTSGLDPALVDAYRTADYHVTGCEPAFVLHVDERSPALAALYAATGSACSAWLTACNPASVLWTDEANDVAQRSLKLRLARGGIRGIDGFGADDYAGFIELIGLACTHVPMRVVGCCLMPNHFHLVVETPQANLFDGMKWLL